MIGRTLLAALLLAAPVAAAVSGVVRNATTGEPAPRVFVTLISFERGMDPIEETATDDEGRFQFEKSLESASGQRIPGLVRTEFEGVSYSEMIPPNAPADAVELEVYSVAERSIPPTGRVLVLEPGESEMIVNETYLLENNSAPPVSYRDPQQGTLRFHLPPEAKGIVQVRASGPAGMPLNSSAEPVGEDDLYKVDFPIKPGDNSISLTYLVPHSEETTLALPTPYEQLQTRIAVPPGVEIEGESLEEMGVEPTTQARIYQGSATAEVRVRGSGALRGSEARAPQAPAAGGGGPTEITIADAPVSRELPWILGLTAAALAAGFFQLYAAGRRDVQGDGRRGS